MVPEKEVDGNENLRQEIELRRKTDAALKSRDLMNLREKLNTIENARKEQKQVSRSGKRVLKYSIMIAGIIIVAGSLTLFNGKKMSNDEIMDHYYKPYGTTCHLQVSFGGTEHGL